MSSFSDAMKALRSLILIEERVTNHGKRLETVAEQVIAMDKRLVRVETVLAMTLRDGLPTIEGPTR
jgi:hypothetical protein